MNSLDASSLASLLTDLAPFFQRVDQNAGLARAVGYLTADLAPFFENDGNPASESLSRPTTAPKVSLVTLDAILTDLKLPLDRAREEGRLGNIWDVAGLKRKETRVSAALSEVWRPTFAGRMSRNFLADYLDIALPSVSWGAELDEGYHVETECRPVGELEDRVDVVIKTARHVVAVEIKIDAPFGHRQLERYLDSMKRSAALTGRTAHVVTLAGHDPQYAGVAATTWHDLARAAERAAGRPVRQRTFTATTIAMFGAYVRRFQ